MRLPKADAFALELLAGSAVNCVVVPQGELAAGFVEAAHKQGLQVLAEAPADSVDAALAAGSDGAVAQGRFNAAARAKLQAAGKRVVEIVPRAELDWQSKPEVLATAQGLWPGIRAEKDGALQAHPTSGPWIETNGGALRFLRAIAAPETAIWITVRPPREPLRAAAYIKALGDAAISGATWLVDLDADLWAALRNNDERARKDWQRLTGVLKFYRDQRALCRWRDYSALALVEEAAGGALVSGGVVDMIAAKHIPVTVTTPDGLTGNGLADTRMLLTLDPAALTAEQKEAARNMARRGGTLVNGPPGWKMELPPPDRVTYSAEQLKQLDEIWREINSLINRRNFAVRVFGAPGMLSNLKAGEGRMALHLVNYTDYPVENVTLHFNAKLKSARWLTPRGERALEVYDTEDGSGVDMPLVEDVGIVLLEAAQEKR
ncbi:MAG: hypothetical protein HY821_12520 [Acidobacteria bacterium]|nr:hypothetical protein [Acidobacteriota bacterium]